MAKEFQRDLYVEPFAWRDWMASLHSISPTCKSVAIMLAMVEAQLAHLRLAWEHLRENPEMDRALQQWLVDLEKAEDALDNYRGVFGLAAPDASACWASVANPLLYGGSGGPALVLEAIKLRNQVVPLLPLDVELRSASSTLGDWLLIADQELSRSAPGEDPTLGDAIDEAKKNIKRFVKSVTSPSLFTKAALGAGAVLGAWIIFKKR